MDDKEKSKAKRAERRFKNIHTCRHLTSYKDGYVTDYKRAKAAL